MRTVLSPRSFRYFLSAALGLLLSLPAAAQPRAAVSFSTALDQPAPGQLTVFVFLQAIDAPFKLGSASLVFDLNTSGLTFPSGSSASAGSAYRLSAPFTGGFPTAYERGLVTQPIDGTIQVEVTYAYTYAGACYGEAISTSVPRQIAEIIFTIEDPTETSGLLWDEALTRVFDDGSLTSPDAPATCDGPEDVQATEIPVGSYAGGDVVLPVELVSFDAQLDGAAAVLQWQTASETNNAGFEVELREAAQGKTAWTTYGFVEGHGTTLEAQQYVYRVEDLVPGHYVFRLRQVDYDGAFEYSPEVEVAVEVPGRYALSPAYPNPFNPQTQFRLAVARAQQVTVAVYDVLGREVEVLFRGELPANESRAFVWQAGQQPSGLYFIRVVGEVFAQTRRVTLLK